MITLEQQIACIERELILRRRAYPRWIAAGKMRQPDADHEIAVMQSVAELLRAQRTDLFNQKDKAP